MDQIADGFQIVLDGGQVGYAVQPKEDCPHFQQQDLHELMKFTEQHRNTLFSQPCVQCGDASENWTCMHCREIHCSRFVNSHMVEHNKKSGHQIVLSLTDLSLWCYECSSYITNYLISKASKLLSSIKFNNQEDKKDETQEIKQLIEQISNLKVTNEDEFTYAKLVDGLKNKKFQKVCILAGAGMSVAAGIPDFRTPGTGLYSQIQKYNLPSPESVFEIEYFKKNPEAFYCVAREFLLTFDAKPTIAHKFLKFLDSRGQLLKCFTQNIDGLELDAGVSQDKVIQAHGHMRTARCIECQEEVSIKDFMSHIKKGEIHRCEKCPKKGLVKPDVVFFGEGLPGEFFYSWNCLKDADLLIVIGTSLKVMPFAASVAKVGPTTPIILINRENVLNGRKNLLHLDGDIEENCKKILQDTN
ncbi:unnamed protein product [Paramecium octaurelia]|uniref:Protein acetyllysine N-acetyltransferase n=1 Tax=Paramecium octaurelia TaxID=43137 RepID=A0A8S1X9W4_PAROT|nr:unnamed protein product [Paramecium octaurelia]